MIVEGTALFNARKKKAVCLDTFFVEKMQGVNWKRTEAQTGEAQDCPQTSKIYSFVSFFWTLQTEKELTDRTEIE